MTRNRFKRKDKLKRKDKNEDTQPLDPELWQRLPQEMLERVIAKLPFARAVAFRLVCKEWYSDIIPRVASHLEASSKSALLYFGCPSGKSKKVQGFAWWMSLYNANSEAIKEFKSKSFPSARRNEDVRLLMCEGGLLFFAFVSRKNCLARDIVVCNPLLANSKSLGLPCPLKLPCEGLWRSHGYPNLVVGATFDSERGSYRLVITEMDVNWRFGTLLYDSLTSAWTIGSSSLPALLEIADVAVALRGQSHVCCTSQRSFCSNGNLYWRVKIRCQDGVGKECLLRFDGQHGTWSFIHNPWVECDYNISFFNHEIFGYFHCAISNGEIFSWHLHRDPMLSKDRPQLLSCEELFDRNNVKPPQFVDWPCKSDINGATPSEIKLMPCHAMGKIYRFLRKIYRGSDYVTFNYQAFNERNSIYHVAGGPVGGISVLVHNTNENLFTKSPLAAKERFANIGDCRAENVWSFTASLTSLP